MGEKPLHGFIICQAFLNAVFRGFLTELPQAEDVPRIKKFFRYLGNTFFSSMSPNLQCIKFVSR